MSETENPAEVLREAAALMRSRAEGVAPAYMPMPQRASIDLTGVCDGCATSTRLVADYDDGWLCGECDAQAAYEGSWDPAVALAVADWLDAELDSASGYPEYVDPAALNVARAYLVRP